MHVRDLSYYPNLIISNCFDPFFKFIEISVFDVVSNTTNKMGLSMIMVPEQIKHRYFLNGRYMKMAPCFVIGVNNERKSIFI